MQNGPMMNQHVAMQQLGPRGQAVHGVHPMGPRMQPPSMQLGPGIQGMPAYPYANQQAAKVGKDMRFSTIFTSQMILFFVFVEVLVNTTINVFSLTYLFVKI